MEIRVWIRKKNGEATGRVDLFISGDKSLAKEILKTVEEKAKEAGWGFEILKHHFLEGERL